jgi:hypothetical protein
MQEMSGLFPEFASATSMDAIVTLSMLSTDDMTDMSKFSWRRKTSRISLVERHAACS